MAEIDSQGVVIKEDDIATCFRLSQAIPEFINPPSPDRYHQRLAEVPHLILVAYIGTQAVGFKVGYQKEETFYSWMGGVLPEFRQKQIAKQLAQRQESWARKQGYKSITFKTRNQHKAMLIFALKNGFNIIGFREKEKIATNRILLRKAL